MNASHETQLHPDSCSCDRCEDGRFEARIADRTATAIADFLAARARSYPPMSAERMAVQADADAVRRGAWRKR